MATLEQERPRPYPRDLTNTINTASGSNSPSTSSPLSQGSLPASPTIVRTGYDAFILPSVPTHEPEDVHLPTSLQQSQHQRVQLESTGQAEAEEVLGNDEEEEVLEELCDEDEASEVLGPQQVKIDLGGTLSAVQGAAIAALQDLVSSMLGSASSTDPPAQSASPAALHGILDSLQAVSVRRSAGPTNNQEDSLTALLARLNSQLDQLPQSDEASASTSSLQDDVNLATALGALLSSLNNVRSPNATGIAESRNGSIESAISSASLIRPPSSMSRSHSSSWRRDSSQGPGSVTMHSSPSASREELRDPFAEAPAREADVYAQLQALMSNLASKCNPSAPFSPNQYEHKPTPFSLPTPPNTSPGVFAASPMHHSPQLRTASSGESSGLRSAGQSSGSASSMYEDKEALASWSQLSHLLGITRELVAARRSLHPAARCSLDSPLSPLRTRSRGASTSSIGESPVLGSTDEVYPTTPRHGLRAVSNLSHGTGEGLKGQHSPRPASVTSENTTAPTIASVKSPQPPQYSEKGGSVAEGASRETSTVGHGESEHWKQRIGEAVSSSGSLPMSLSGLPAYMPGTQSSRDEKSTYEDEKSAAHETEATAAKARALSTPDTSAYTARTSQDLRMVQSSIDRLYHAVPQLSDQRASLGDSARQLREVNLQELVDRLGRSGRMEDQRASLPTPRTPTTAATSPTDSPLEPSPSSSSPSKMALPPIAPSQQNKSLGRRFSVGSKFQNLRSAASFKGKARESSPRPALLDLTSSSEREVPAREELLPLFDDIQMAKEMAYHDQRAEMRPRIRASKPDKLAKMGLSEATMSRPKSASGVAAQLDDDEDDNLFAMLSGSRSRMPDQDAPLRRGPRPPRLSSPTSRQGSDLSSPRSVTFKGRIGVMPSPTVAPSATDSTSDSGTLTIGHASSIATTAPGSRPDGQPTVGQAAAFGGWTQSAVSADGEASGSSSTDAEPSQLLASPTAAIPPASGELTPSTALAGQQPADSLAGPAKFLRGSGGHRLRFFAEHQKQLGVISLYAFHEDQQEGTSIETADILSYHTMAADAADGEGVFAQFVNVSFVAGPETTSTRCCLPTAALHPQSGSVRRDGDHYQIKLRSKPIEQCGSLVHEIFSEHAEINAPLGAEKLTTIQPSRFACDACGAVVINAPGTSQYRALPSQHWEELIDSWMCHEDQLLNVSVTRGREGMVAGRTIPQQCAWVAEDIIAWPGSAVQEGSVITDRRPRDHTGSGEVSEASLWSSKIVSDSRTKRRLASTYHRRDRPRRCAEP
ncbi:hypothetical protein IE81DRAFT_71989 [Ceraceosorus guamensis]|uniref:Uncharacterized protein n=1 Tax=Ceraceosorus guamensis TaxID=1522189 RepID=A0A316W4L1_9BASI|nr:hypothetical protein IE81DRAFT_71989 [Ceraceosorus guamensis]PWN43591.1 hypothetical protein IE81DRAFT_71989 [Ceraceosorus guamensis]